MDSHHFIRDCINNTERREIHGRTPEELFEWKSQFIQLQAALDDALVDTLYSVRRGDLIACHIKSAALMQARQNVLDHLEDL